MTVFAVLGVFSILCVLTAMYGLLITEWRRLVRRRREGRTRTVVARRSPSIPAAPQPLPPLPKRIARAAYAAAVPHPQMPLGEPTDHDIFCVIAEATNACRDYANQDRKGERR